MTLTLDELQAIKHQLPKGSVRQIAQSLQIEEDVVRSFFGAHRHRVASPDWHFEAGPNGGLVQITDTAILDAANQIIQNQPSPS